MSQQTEDKAANLPNPAEMAQTYAEVAQRASRILTQFMEKKAKEGVDAPSDELGVAKAFMDLSAHLLANPVKLAQTQMNMMWDYFSLWQSSMMKMVGMPVSGPVAAPKKGDNRFRDEDWEQHFLFDFIKQSYLITARHLHDTVSGAEGLDEHTQQKVNFFTRQYIDALSPSNFAMTNPEVFRETVKSHGQNLIKGFNNLLHDVEQGDGQLRIRMTDTSAFEMGKNVATTPGKVIFQNELFQLIQYDPTTKDQYKKPFLIVPPWINKYYILDLREKNSLVKWATDQGHTTFIMSWVNPDE
ncbi:MAG: class I poly(R)-hydroxyalkanoic acid synthase, partial [Betaproteobacteria bacterium]|nr:class I poly(R)-hydroxyalkanoic acid synthase [Betaproteobacteria bacterium]